MSVVNFYRGFWVLPIFLAVALAVLAGQTQDAQAAASASAIRIGEHSDKTRVVIDLNIDVKRRIYRLADPYRIVVDLPEIDWRLTKKNRLLKGGIIRGLRYGRFRPGKSRIVFDLGGPAKIAKVFMIAPRNNKEFRLVIDLVPQTRAAFLASLEQRAPRRKTPARKKAKIPDKAKTALATPSPRSRPRKGEKFSIVIDPGHGGLDPGAIGVNGTYEKNVTLAFARQLQKILRSTGRYTVRLTRYDDRFVSLRSRVSFARRNKANLFISIHADSIADRKFRGGGIYTLSEKASDKEAAALAAKENRADVIAGVDLTSHDDQVASILIDLTQRETMNFSARFAERLIPELKSYVHLRNKPHRFAGFRVLKAPDVPSVLVELGYLSNRQDEKMLTSVRSRGKIAKSMVRAIERYVAALSG
jgi:N-acetylmuramoyl-L-alanine amidase